MLMVASVRSASHSPSPTHASPGPIASITGYTETPKGSEPIPKVSMNWKAVGFNGPPTFDKFTVTSNSEKLKGALASNSEHKMIWADHLSRTDKDKTVPYMSNLIQEFANRRHISPIQRLIITNIEEDSTKAVLNSLEADFYVPGNEFYERIMKTTLGKTASYLGTIKSIYVKRENMFVFYIDHTLPPHCSSAGQSGSGSGSGTHASAHVHSSATHVHSSPQPSASAAAGEDVGCCKGCIIS